MVFKQVRRSVACAAIGLVLTVGGLVGAVFQGEVPHCALVSLCEHRRVIKIAGRGFTVAQWEPMSKAGADSLKVLGLPRTKEGSGLLEYGGYEYDELTKFYKYGQVPHDSLNFIKDAMDDVLRTECAKLENGEYSWITIKGSTQIPSLQFAIPLDLDLDTCVYVPLLLRFQNAIDATECSLMWKEFRIHRNRSLVEVYNLVQVGRCAFPHQVYCSDVRYSLADIPFNTKQRVIPRMSTTQHGGGNPLSGLDGPIVSTVITRQRDGGGNETYIDKHMCLVGVLPKALVDTHQFWARDANSDSACMTLVGYPIDERGHLQSYQEGEQMLEVLISRKTGRALVHRFTPRFDQSDAWHANIVATSDSSVLLDFAAAPKGSTLFQLGDLFARVENLSHVLAWTKTSSKKLVSQFQASGLLDAATDFSIDAIDLPRLKQKFALKRVSETETRCYSIDVSGFWISSRSHPSLAKLRNGLPFTLLLENTEGELQLWCPAYTSIRPSITYLPFSTHIVGDRRSSEWLSTRVYVYPVHCSMTFCSFPTTASMLHYALQLFLNRNYIAAAKLAAQACIDSSVTNEEQYMMSKFLSTCDDKHPDACAVRLKLRLATLHCNYEIGTDNDGVLWPRDYAEYIQKLAHISTECRLTRRQEELLLTNLQEIGTTTAFDGKTSAYWCNGQGVVKNEGQAGATLNKNCNPIEILTIRFNYKHARSHPLVNRMAAMLGEPAVAPPPEPGGAFWFSALDKVNSMSDSASWITYIQYKRPTGDCISGTRALELFDRFLKDEIDSKGQKLGCILCNEMILGEVKAGVLDQVPSVLSSVRWCTMLLKTICFKFGEKMTDSQLTVWGSCIQTVEMLDADDEPIDDDSTMQEAVAQLELPELLVTGHEDEWAGEYGTGWRAMPLWDMDEEGYSKILHGWSQQWRSARKRLCKQARWRTAMNRGKDKKCVHGADCDGAQAGARLSNLDVGIPRVTDCNATQRTLKAVQSPACLSINAEAVSIFASRPLECLPGGLDPFIELYRKTASVNGAVPFNLRTHKDANSTTAEDMLSRIDNDMQRYAEQQNSGETPVLRCITPEKMDSYRTEWSSDNPTSPKWGQSATLELKKLLKLLVAQADKDTVAMCSGIQHVEADTNRVELQGNEEDALARTTHHLMRIASQRGTADFEFITATLLSSNSSKDLCAINPFLTDTSELADATAAIMFLAIRVCQLQRCIGATLGLIDGINRAVAPGYLQKAIDALVGNCYGSRAFAKQAETASFHYDPCYLAFEYLTGFLLRSSQVYLVDTFMGCATAGKSLVHQMIMGAGKTTCIAPLLSMKLADGNKLVSLVCPAALLQMSRNQLWKFFARVVQKAIYTYTFGRASCGNTGAATKLLNKLQTARSQKAIVVATPTAIKSTLLKYLDLLSRGKQCKSADERKEKLAVADITASIMSLWGKQQGGVLILDEVDALLHPLRSELNFPVGQKKGTICCVAVLPVCVVALYWYHNI